MTRFIHWCCYQTKRLSDVNYDSKTGSLMMPYGASGSALRVTYVEMLDESTQTRKVQVKEATQVTPRRWFQVAKTLIHKHT